MKTHFASDDNQDGELNHQIDEFKHDSEKMEALTEFIEDVIKTAEIEAHQKITQDLQQSGKEKSSSQSFTIGDIKNGKVINRARGLVVRIFDAICNCANNATAPTQRIRRKRSSQPKQ